jgi:hypothetical protein
MSDLIKHTDLSAEPAVDPPQVPDKVRSFGNTLTRHSMYLATWMAASWFASTVLHLEGVQAGLMGLAVAIGAQAPKTLAKLLIKIAKVLKKTS